MWQQGKQDNHNTMKHLKHIFLELGCFTYCGNCLDVNILIINNITARPQLQATFKGIFQPFELGAVTRLIPSAVKFGHLKKKNLMIQSHERSLKQISAA